jgi:hypothetical protein
VRQPAIESALRGKVLVQLSSGTPDEAREMESWARPRGIEDDPDHGRSVILLDNCSRTLVH